MKSWHPALRNKSDDVLKALAEAGGMLGVSMYPFHLRGGPDCSLDDFCGMIADAAELMGIDHVGIGSDLVQGHDDSIVEWMRNGRWSKQTDFGEGSAEDAGWPDPAAWFTCNRDFPNLARGLKDKGFADGDIDKVMGLNWLRFFETSFGPMPGAA
tara:strand:- start:20 stop:484 length:465 start_codon:yes stop_codon:yes gene_type:complete